MIRTIRELRRQMDARADAEEIERDEEGRAVIDMTVLRDEDFLSDFSAKKPVVSSEVADFLQASAMAFSPKEPICLKIYSDCIDSEEEKVYSKALTEYYVRHYKSNRRDLRRNAITSSILFLIGLLTLSVTLLVMYFNVNPLVEEVLDILSWVFLWEAFDQFFIERLLLRIDRRRYLRLIEAKILFLPREQGGEGRNSEA